MNNQNLSFFDGENLVDLFFFSENIIRIKMEATRATTPPSFEGMDRSTT